MANSANTTAMTISAKKHSALRIFFIIVSHTSYRRALHSCA